MEVHHEERPLGGYISGWFGVDTGIENIYRFTSTHKNGACVFARVCALVSVRWCFQFPCVCVIFERIACVGESVVCLCLVCACASIPYTLC